MRRITIDIIFAISLCVFLVVVHWRGWDGYLFKLPYVTLLTFYYLGKFARGMERKENDSAEEQLSV